MSDPNPQPGGFGCTDCFSRLAAIAGAVAGVVIGGERYGTLGAILGLPVGAIVGVLAVVALIAVPVLTVVLVTAVAGLVRGGPKEFVRVLRDGPDWMRDGRGPPASPNQACE
jgi:hypothetical protein